MRIIDAEKNSLHLSKNTAVGLGTFDGLHIGHIALVNTLVSEAKLNNLHSLLYTFVKHPCNILRKKLFPDILTPINKKAELLSGTSLDYLYCEKFDEVYSRIQPEQFVKDILVDRLAMRLAVVGFNYRFGYKGMGDAELLKKLGKKFDYSVTVIPPIKVDNEIVSSTLIRKYVIKGKMSRVFKMLGRHYSIKGTVIDGKKIGNTIGFPTANIHPENYMVTPGEGVYITKTYIDNMLYDSITNIRQKSVFYLDDCKYKNQSIVETYIFDLDRMLYGKELEVYFIEKIRDEKNFESLNELKIQIEKDIKIARSFQLRK